MKNIFKRNPGVAQFSIRVKWHMNLKLLGLIFHSYFRGFRYVFFGFVQPIFIFAIFYFIFTEKLNMPAQQVISGYLLLAPITAALISFSNLLSEWKQSVLLKRLDVTPISKANFMLVAICFFFVMAFIAAFWMILWAIIFLAAQHKSISDIFGQLNWGWFILTLIVLIIICNTIAILIAGVSDSAGRTQGFIMMIYFPSAFLGGVLIPMATVDQVDALRWISYFLPFKYPAMLSAISWQGTGAIVQNWMDPTTGTVVKTWTEFPNVWLPILLGFVYAFIVFGIAMKTFKWTVRN